MKKRFLITLIIPLLLLFACKKDDTNVQTETVELKADGYVEGPTHPFQSGFETGEEAAVTLGPVSNTSQITKVRFFFGGNVNPSTRDIVLKIYKDIGTVNPDALLFIENYNLQSSNSVMQEIDISERNIRVDGGSKIRVSIQMSADGNPCIARDDGVALSQLVNWVKETNGTWISSFSFGDTGNWIIRATVETEI